VHDRHWLAPAGPAARLVLKPAAQGGRGQGQQGEEYPLLGPPEIERDPSVVDRDRPQQRQALARTPGRRRCGGCCQRRQAAPV